MLDFSQRRFVIIFLLVSIGGIAFGTIGYMLLESFTMFEGFYMTMITVTTVGFGEIRPLSPAGRGFTCILIVFGVSYIAVMAQAITITMIRSLMEPDHSVMNQKIDDLEGHYIICGFGRVGLSASEYLIKKGSPFVVIDRNADDLLEEFPEMKNINILILQGDATDEAVLKKAGIQKAKGLMCVLPSDPDNLFIILTARELNKDLHIVSRTSNKKNHEKRLLRAGADEVISPYRIAGIEIATCLLTATKDKI